MRDMDACSSFLRKIRRLVVGVLCFLLTSGLPAQEGLNKAWLSFKTTYNKTYESSSIEQERRSVWEKNLDIIWRHNLAAAKGGSSFSLGMNELGDMTSEEVREKLNGFNIRAVTFVRNKTQATMETTDSPRLPKEIDWRKKGYVTPVKNQGKCGGCWAFAATGAMEGQHFRAKGKLVSLSEQNLIDCSRSQGNHGCEGGIMDDAFKYAEQVGVEPEQLYAYTGKDGDCKFHPDLQVVKLSGFKDVKRQDETALATAVATVGPIAIAIDAGHPSFHLYKDGVYDEPQCSPMALTHGVLAVGYGSEDGKDYWLVKNSWGESWGMAGYIKMSRNKGNQCGIATLPSYPVI